MEKKNIIRVQKRENPYVIIDKTALNDDRLSWKAKGLLNYLISLPDDWTVHERDLAKRSKDGRDSTRAGIKELIQYGYVVRKRLHDSSGHFAGWETVVYEVPQAVEVDEKDESPRSENPTSEKPTSEKPTSENPTYTNYPLDKLTNELNATTTSGEQNEMVNDYSTAQDAYMKAGWGLPNGFSSQVLQSDIEDHGLAIVLHAIETAAMRNAKSYYYTKSMFKEWSEKGLGTVEQIEKYEESKSIAWNKPRERFNGRSQTAGTSGAPVTFKDEF